MSRSRREPKSLVRCCIEAAQAAGGHAMTHRPRRSEIHEQFAHDVKLKLDHESQACAFAAIRKIFPDDSIVGEEGSERSDADYEWIVDPIDGTVNFFHGITWWCSSVAVRSGDQILAGAIYAPEQNMLFEASVDSVAMLNGREISSSSVSDTADALAITGSEKEMLQGVLPLTTGQKMALHVQKVRILGAAALDICQVACGAADIFYQNGLYLWDVAAAGLIVNQAGGIYKQKPTAIKGRYTCFAAANNPLEKSFQKSLPELSF